MIIAVTRNDETNMVVCQLASSLFNVSKKIARIRTKDFLEESGVNFIINQTFQLMLLYHLK